MTVLRKKEDPSHALRPILFLSDLFFIFTLREAGFEPMLGTALYFNQLEEVVYVV